MLYNNSNFSCFSPISTLSIKSLPTTAPPKMCDCVKNLFPKVNKNSLVKHFIPLTGTLCHNLFAINYMSPKFFETYLVKVGNNDILCNGLFISANVGLFFFIYNRRQMSKMASGSRSFYSIYLSCLFNSGSVLIFDWWKSFLPENTFVKASVGFFGSVLLIYIGKKYYDAVDPRASIVETYV